jgi:hypothetical protein
LALSVTIPASCRIGGGESGGNALKAKLVDLSYLGASFMERLVFPRAGKVSLSFMEIEFLKG